MMVDQEKSPSKNVFSEWLEQLQQESWQLELLISGLALFGIWGLRPELQRLSNYISVNVVNPVDFFGNLVVSLLWIGWTIFMVNLVLHIFIRGLWIGAIGLRYVSGEIDYERLNFSEIFTSYFQKRIGTYDQYIERLERTSSVIFSFTFLAFFMFLSFTIYTLIFIMLMRAISGLVNNGAGNEVLIGFIGICYLMLGIIMFLDFITMGGFKRIKDKTVSRIFYFVYRIVTTITLAFIYRPLLLNFLDNKYTKKLLYLSIPYVLILVLGSFDIRLERYAYIPGFNDRDPYTEYVDRYGVNWNNYDDLRTQHYLTYSKSESPSKKAKIKIASIPQYELREDILQLFLKYQKNDSRLIAKQYPEFTQFRNTGLHHGLFTGLYEPDLTISELRAKESNELRYFRMVRSREKDKITNPDLLQFQHKKDEYLSIATQDVESYKKAISQDYRDQRIAHMEQRYQASLDMIISNYSIYINDSLITTNLRPKYYTHPNLHEQGLLCYLDVHTLPAGLHTLKIRKKVYSKTCPDQCPETVKYISFLKL